MPLKCDHGLEVEVKLGFIFSSSGDSWVYCVKCPSSSSSVSLNYILFKLITALGYYPNPKQVQFQVHQISDVKSGRPLTSNRRGQVLYCSCS